jgi:hypothetical protein
METTRIGSSVANTCALDLNRRETRYDRGEEGAEEMKEEAEVY